MKYILAFLVVLIGLTACGEKYDTDYQYTYKSSVVYANGDRDTIVFGGKSFNGNEVFVSLSNRGRGGACITVSCGFYTENVACDVRRFDILETTKVLIPKSK